MAISNLKPKFAALQDDLVQLTGGSPIAWPEGVVRIPSNLAEALRDGWRVTAEDADDGATESYVTGFKDLVKFAGGIELHIRVPYKAMYSHGKPRKHQAHRVAFVNRKEFLEGLRHDAPALD